MKSQKSLFLVMLYVLLFVIAAGITVAATCQVTVEGSIYAAPGVMATVTAENGQVYPMNIRGKRNHYKVTFENDADTWLLTFNSHGAKKFITVHTHVPDDVRLRSWIELNVRFTQEMPERSVIYYSPISERYEWRDEITPEDSARLAALQLWPGKR